MYSVYQHWDPLKTCIVGKSYPPEFYSWIKNPKTRSIFERIAQETEEDYQSLIKILTKFNVEVLRPDIPSDYELLFNPIDNMYVKPPMTPRDYTGMYGSTFVYDKRTLTNIYNSVKHNNKGQPTNLENFHDVSRLDTETIDKIFNKQSVKFDDMCICSEGNDVFMGSIINKIKPHVIYNQTISQVSDTSTATTTRIGKDLYVDKEMAIDLKNVVDKNFRINETSNGYHTDAVFCPVVPGLIISLQDITNYKDTFPGWEVVYLPDQSWSKVQPFLELKEKNQGKWWIPGEEYNDDVIKVVDTWLSKWVGYVEETVFDVNMLVIDEKNVVVNNYNKQVFNALERYGVTPHICNFRHRYFWDGGLHCITSDLDREGEMKDYFPERNK